MFAAARRCLAVLVVPALLSLCPAQQPSNPPARSLLVNVFDLQGNAIRDLSKENFRLRVNGKPAAVLDAQYSVAPRRVLVLLDTSGSMGDGIGSKKWKIAHAAVQELLAQSPPDVPIGMMTFSDRVREIFFFSQDRASLTKWLQEGPSEGPLIKGQTALFDAILGALNSLRPFRTGDAIYVITDGGDNMSHVSAGRVRRALLDSGVRLFAFLFGEAPFPPNEEEGQRSFKEMAADSGGFVFGVSGRQAGVTAGYPSWDSQYDYNKPTEDRIKKYTQELNTQIHGFWTLQLAAPASNKARKIKLDVVDAQGRDRKGVAFTYQQVLTAPTGQVLKAE